MKKIIIYLTFLFLFCNCIYAAPPFSTEQIIRPSVGLQFAVPEFTYYILDSEVKLHFHVHNSTFFLLDNTTTFCSIHIYNQSGNHIVREEGTVGFDGIDFEYTFNVENFTQYSAFHYIFYCNSTQSRESGFITGNFELTRTGQPPIHDAAATTGVFGFIVLLTIALFMLPKFVGRFFRDDFSNYVMSRMLMILGMLFVTFDLSMAISIADMFTLGIVQAMFTLMYIINWGIYISMIVVLYITILKSLEMWNTKKQNKRNGIDENFEG